MSKSPLRKSNTSSESLERDKQIRDRFDKEKPSAETLSRQTSQFSAIEQGQYLELMKVFSLLKEAREAAGLSLTQMSQRTGMDRSAISRLENGVYGNPTVKTLYKYVQALGKNILFKIVDDSK